MSKSHLTRFSVPLDLKPQVALEGDGARQTATVQFQFKLTPQEQENIRWYLEDYLQYLSDPAPQIAAKVEQGMAAIGVELFKAIFQANDDARDLWATLRQNLNNTRVEILTDIAQATTIPWELLRDPKTDTCLSLRSPAFVRSYSQAAQRPRLPQADGDAIRILLVICRPRGRADVPFRSVASRLIKGLGNKPDGFQLDVLRPPTFEQLSRVLRQAKAQGKPYHVVHFDGHGVYQDGSQLMLSGNPLVFDDRRPGRHGYLAFENALAADNVEFVSGSDLGRLLVETDVPVLVLNACRSAHAETQDAPTQVNDTAPDQLDDPHSQVRAFGSLAQEVMDAGVAGVVAMRYNVYVITAAQFVANLYASLVQGQTLGEAVTSGRKQLKDQPQREVAYKPVTLQDWVVPVVYEAAAIALFPTPTNTPTLTITLHENDALPTTGLLDAQLPKTPDVGFFGRDETLLAIDRSFDHHAIVLLHAFAGSGKTSTAAEFGRWYALTGGLLEAGKQGFVLFTSFQRYLPLPRVLDKLGQVFERDLAQSGIHWLALSDDQRRAVALQVLSQVSVLWVWDNVEPVAGFPDGETQRWDEAEQQELADFLRDAQNTKAKFLLTSRRDERAWLGDLPTRVQVPPMPMQERVQFARELAKKHGYHLRDIGNWFPLLKYTQGNPLTITVVLGQALRNRYRSKEQIENFVAELQSGEAELDDDESEGRSKSLSASLSYGFTHTFNKKERQQLALLHLFQGFVNVDVFCLMGKPDEGGHISTIHGLTKDQGINLLDRAAEVGLLSSLRNGSYMIHPVLPWHFKRLFEKEHTTDVNNSLNLIIRVFVEAMGNFGNLYHDLHQSGDHNVITTLLGEEENLLYARQLARFNKWLVPLLGVMQGLRTLYEYTGRFSELSRFIAEIVPDVTHSSTDKALPECQMEWVVITECRVHLAVRERQWEEAERLQRLIVDYNLEQTKPIPTGTVDLEAQCYLIKALAVSLEGLGNILRDQDCSACVDIYEQAISLCQRIDDPIEEGIIAFNLGQVYLNISDIRDLEEAEYWSKHSLDIFSKLDQRKYVSCLMQLGRVTYEMFKEALIYDQPEATLSLGGYLMLAESFYTVALDEISSDDIGGLSVIHNNLSCIRRDMGEISRAIVHANEAVYYYEMLEDQIGAAGALGNAASALISANRFDDALIYAQAAVQKFEAYGDRTTEDIQDVKRLIELIQQLIADGNTS